MNINMQVKLLKKQHELTEIQALNKALKDNLERFKNDFKNRQKQYEAIKSTG